MLQSILCWLFHGNQQVLQQPIYEQVLFRRLDGEVSSGYVWRAEAAWFGSLGFFGLNWERSWSWSQETITSWGWKLPKHPPFTSRQRALKGVNRLITSVNVDRRTSAFRSPVLKWIQMSFCLCWYVFPAVWLSVSLWYMTDQSFPLRPAGHR